VIANASALATYRIEMNVLTSQLPEYPVVMGMYGMGDTLRPQLIAEIGDVRKYKNKQGLSVLLGYKKAPVTEVSSIAGALFISAVISVSSVKILRRPWLIRTPPRFVMLFCHNFTKISTNCAAKYWGNATCCGIRGIYQFGELIRKRQLAFCAFVV